MQITSIPLSFDNSLAMQDVDHLVVELSVVEQERHLLHPQRVERRVERSHWDCSSANLWSPKSVNGPRDATSAESRRDYRTEPVIQHKHQQGE